MIPFKKNLMLSKTTMKDKNKKMLDRMMRKRLNNYHQDILKK